MNLLLDPMVMVAVKGGGGLGAVGGGAGVATGGGVGLVGVVEELPLQPTTVNRRSAATADV